MKNKGQEICSEKNDAEAQLKEWEKRSVKEDSTRFRHIIKESRQRLGLEASHA